MIIKSIDWVNSLTERGHELLDFGAAKGISFEGGAALDKKVLMFSMIVVTQAQVCYETGFNAGGSAVCIAEACKITGGKYVGFEISTQRYPVIQEFLRKYPGNEMVMGDSGVTLPQRWEATQESPDFFFVDGGHTGAAAARDVQHALSIMKPGSIIMLDDVKHPPVRKAILDRIPEEQVIWFDKDINGPGSCIYQVK